MKISRGRAATMSAAPSCPCTFVPPITRKISRTTRHFVKSTRHLVQFTRHLVQSTRHLVQSSRHLVQSSPNLNPSPPYLPLYIHDFALSPSHFHIFVNHSHSKSSGEGGTFTSLSHHLHSAVTRPSSPTQKSKWNSRFLRISQKTIWPNNKCKKRTIPTHQNGDTRSLNC